MIIFGKKSIISRLPNVASEFLSGGHTSIQVVLNAVLYVIRSVLADDKQAPDTSSCNAIYSFSWCGQTHALILFWCPCFGFLVISPMGFKVRVKSKNLMHAVDDIQTSNKTCTSTTDIASMSCWGLRFLYLLH